MSTISDIAITVSIKLKIIIFYFRVRNSQREDSMKQLKVCLLY